MATQRRAPAPVQVQQVSPVLMRTALAQADGNPARLVVESLSAVSVYPTARAASAARART